MIQSVIAEALIRMRLVDEANTNKIDQAKKKIDDVNKSTKNLGKSAKEAGMGFRELSFEMRSIAIVMGAISAATLGFVTASMKEFADFEYEMASVKSVTSATDAQMKSLSGTILDLGAQTQYYSTQVAQTAKAMGQMGLKAKEIAGLLPEVLSLATIENIAPAKSAEVIVGSMKALAEPLEYIGKLADTLAFASANSATTIEDLGMALARSGAASKAAGQSFTSTISVLMTLADRNIRSAKAGQAYVMMLNRLTKAMGDMKERTTAQGELMKKFNINLEGSDGKIKGFIDVLLELKNKGMGSVDMLTLFGDRTTKYVETLIPAAEHMKALNMLLDENAELYKKLNEAMAKVKMDTVKGDALKLSSAFKNLQNVLSEGNAGPFRDLMQSITNIISKAQIWVRINPELASSIMIVVAGVGALTAVVGLATVAIFAFSIAGGPLILILGGIIALAIVGALAWKKWQKASEEAGKSAKDTKSSLEELKTAFELYQGFGSLLEIALKKIVGGIYDLFEGLFSMIEKSTKIFSKASGFFSWWWKSAGEGESQLAGLAREITKINAEMDWKGDRIEKKDLIEDGAVVRVRKELKGLSELYKSWWKDPILLKTPKDDVSDIQSVLAANTAKVKKSQEAVRETESLIADLMHAYSEATKESGFMTETMFLNQKEMIKATYESAKAMFEETSPEIFKSLPFSFEDALIMLKKQSEKQMADLNEAMFGKVDKAAKVSAADIIQTYESMYDVLEFNSEKYYNRKKDLLEKQRDEEIRITKDTSLAYEVYYERLRQLENKRIRDKGSATEGIKLFFDEESRKSQSWASETETAMGDFKDAMKDASFSITRNTESISGAFENMANSILDSLARIGTNMLINSLFSMVGNMITPAATTSLASVGSAGYSAPKNWWGGNAIPGVTSSTLNSTSGGGGGGGISIGTYVERVDATDAHTFNNMLKRSEGTIGGIASKQMRKNRGFEKTMKGR